MIKVNQAGRSMVEMLGVLAIIGVLTVGSLGVVGKARRQYMISQALSDISNLIASARKMSCDYDSEYGSYTNMLYLSHEYPNGVTFAKNNNKDTFLLTSDIALEIVAEGEDKFKAILSDIPEDACVAIAAADWGNKRFNGFLGSKIGTVTSDATTMKIDPGSAAEACSADSVSVELTYIACVKGGDNNASSD